MTSALLCGCLLGVAVRVWPPSVRAIRGLPGRDEAASAGAARRPGEPGSLRARARSFLLSVSSVWPVSSVSFVRRWLRGRDDPPTMTQDDVLTLVEDLATQVRAGAPPQTAWSVAVSMRPGQPLGTGDQPRETLRRLASRPGAPAALIGLHAAWSLSEDVGTPLAEVLRTVAEAIRQDGDVQADIEAALASPRSTARLLAVLPLAGLGLGQVIGARPIQVLLQTGIGRACAVGGLVLALVGQWWTRRLVARTSALL